MDKKLLNDLKNALNRLEAGSFDMSWDAQVPVGMWDHVLPILPRKTRLTAASTIPQCFVTDRVIGVATSIYCRNRVVGRWWYLDITPLPSQEKQR